MKATKTYVKVRESQSAMGTTVKRDGLSRGLTPYNQPLRWRTRQGGVVELQGQTSRECTKSVCSTTHEGNDMLAEFYSDDQHPIQV